MLEKFLLDGRIYSTGVVIFLQLGRDVFLLSNDKSTFNEANLKFALEQENNKKIEFLDVLVDNSGDKVITLVYRKPKWSGLCLDFHSLSPMQNKMPK